MTLEGGDLADAPVRSGSWTPVTFDLSAEQARQSRADRRTYGWYFGGAIAIGLFALLGFAAAPPRSSSEVLWGLAAVLFLVLPSLGLYYTFVGGVTALELADAGVTVRRFGRSSITIPWSDPKLGIRVTEFTAPPATFFRGNDPRGVHPQWVFISAPVRSETTVPADVVSTLTRWAEGRGVRVERSPALIFAVAAPRSPGVTPAARRILPGDTTTPNGRITLIGPAARSD